jgi:hypothetical protein
VSHLYYPGLDKRQGKRLLRGRLLLILKKLDKAENLWKILLVETNKIRTSKIFSAKGTPMFEKIIIGIIVAGAVYYLYRRFRATTSTDGASCGCGCDSCGTDPIECRSNGSGQEKK